MHIAVILVVLVIAIFLMRDTILVTKNILGSWIGSPDFCDKAGVDSFIFLIQSVSSTKIEGNLIIVVDEMLEIVPCSLRYFALLRPHFCVSARIDCDIMPETATIEYSLYDGHIRIVDNETIYADIYRDNTIVFDQ